MSSENSREDRGVPVKPPIPPVFWWSLVAGGSVLAVHVLMWKLVDVLTVFIAPIAALAVYRFFTAVACWAVGHALRGLRRREPRSGWALGVCVAFLMATWVIPWPALMQDLDFEVNLKQRETIVAMARQGRLMATAANFHHKDLPGRYRHLSAGGDVIVEKPTGNTRIFFYTYRGLLTGGVHGFLYTADDKPTLYEAGRLYRVVKKRKNWYAISME